MKIKECEVSNNQRTKKLPKIILGQFSFAIVITIVAVSISYYAQGFRFDLKDLSLVRTGVLVLGFQPKDATVTVNQKVTDSSGGGLALNLSPGNYTVRIDKNKYASFDQSVKIEAESVSILDKIVLFLKEPVITELSDQSKIAMISAPSEDLAKSNSITTNNYEIWSGERLITRFATPIKRAIWYPDFRHIIFSQGREIRIISDDGKSDTLLVTLSMDQNSRFAINGRGDELYFEDQNKFYQAKIK